MGGRRITLVVGIAAVAALVVTSAQAAPKDKPGKRDETTISSSRTATRRRALSADCGRRP
jgi:hypothetical protein